ncbi:MAG: hypothetical protein ACPGYV_06300 [Phycisphaeraceae bacterium]
MSIHPTSHLPSEVQSVSERFVSRPAPGLGRPRATTQAPATRAAPTRSSATPEPQLLGATVGRGRRLFFAFAFVFAGCLLVVAAAWLVMTRLGAPATQLTDDATSITGMPFYTGMFTTLSIKLWSIAGAVAALAGLIIVQTDRRLRTGLFFLVAAFISFFLGLDDAFLLHENALPKLTGLPEKAILLAYATLMMVFVYNFRRTILRTELILLVFSGVCFVISLVVDTNGSLTSQLTGVAHPGMIEDGFKIAGILAWTAYLAHAAINTIIPKLRQAAAAASS